MAGYTNARVAVAAAVVLMLAGCVTTRELPRPVPVVETLVVDCTTQLPEWVFEPFDVPGLLRVKELGGRNKELLMVFNLQALLLDSANQRLATIFEEQQKAAQECAELSDDGT